MQVNGKAVHFAHPREAQAQGIATIYQEFSLYPELTVAENIFSGNMPRKFWGWCWIGPGLRETRPRFLNPSMQAILTCGLVWGHSQLATAKGSR